MRTQSRKQHRKMWKMYSLVKLKRSVNPIKNFKVGGDKVAVIVKEIRTIKEKPKSLYLQTIGKVS